MLAESEKTEMHLAGFDETYAWSIKDAMKYLYESKFTVGQFDSVLKHNIQVFPKWATVSCVASSLWARWAACAAIIPLNLFTNDW